MPINANVTNQQITASVGETQIDVAVSGGFGPSGAAGTNGQAATVAVGTVTTGAPGSSASVVNAGSSSAAVLNFTIPAGPAGATGPQGPAGGDYTLPVATASVLGGVKIGSGITITDGVISTSSGYTLPTATGSVLGGVKIGSGVTITDGVISVSTNYAAASHGHAIADVTGLQAALDGKQASGSYAAASHGHAIADVSGLQTALDGKASVSHTHSASDTTSGEFDPFRLPIATTNARGAVRIGSGISIDGNGVISASAGDSVSIDTTAADVLSATSGAISADDPGADRLVFWDDSAGKLTHLTVGSGLTISGTTITSAGSTSASDLTSGTLNLQRLPTRVRNAANLYLWSSFR